MKRIAAITSASIAMSEINRRTVLVAGAMLGVGWVRRDIVPFVKAATRITMVVE